MTNHERLWRCLLLLGLTVGFASAAHSMGGAHHEQSWGILAQTSGLLVGPIWYATRRRMRFGGVAGWVLGLQGASHVLFATLPLMLGSAAANSGAGHHTMTVADSAATQVVPQSGLVSSIVASMSPAMITAHMASAVVVALLWAGADAALVHLQRWLSWVLNLARPVAVVTRVACVRLTMPVVGDVGGHVSIRGPPVFLR